MPGQLPSGPLPGPPKPGAPGMYAGMRPPPLHPGGGPRPGMRPGMPLIFPQPGNAAMYMRPPPATAAQMAQMAHMQQQLARPGGIRPMLMPMPGAAAGGTGGGPVPSSLPGGAGMPRPPMPMPMQLPAPGPPPAAGVPVPSSMPVPASGTAAAPAAGQPAAGLPAAGQAAAGTAAPGQPAAAGAAVGDAAWAEGKPLAGAAAAGGGGVGQEDIQMVQNLIERCLQLYMTQVGCRGLLQRAAARCFVLQKGGCAACAARHCRCSLPTLSTLFYSPTQCAVFPSPAFHSLPCPALPCPALPCPALPCPALLPCLQNEVVSILQQQAKIEPGFTQLVWQKLEEQNPEFFRSAISTQYSPSAVS